MRDLFTHRVDLEERVLSTDEYLGQVETWRKVRRNLRGRLEPISEREKSLFHREGMTLTHRFFFKPIPQGIDEYVTRVVMGSRVFDIVGIRDEDEQGILMVLHLQEVHEPVART